MSGFLAGVQTADLFNGFFVFAGIHTISDPISHIRRNLPRVLDLPRAVPVQSRSPFLLAAIFKIGYGLRIPPCFRLLIDLHAVPIHTLFGHSCKASWSRCAVVRLRSIIKYHVAVLIITITIPISAIDIGINVMIARVNAIRMFDPFAVFVLIILLATLASKIGLVLVKAI